MKIKETIYKWGHYSQLVGILAHAGDLSSYPGTCVVFLNAGLLHKVGPNRLYVTLSRQLAESGISCFRFDLSGIGDSGLSEKKDLGDGLVPGEIRETLDMLSQRAGFSRYILAGICSGAEAAYKAAIDDSRITGLVLIDGIYLPAEGMGGLYAAGRRRNAGRYYRKHLFDVHRWKKLLSGKSALISRQSGRMLLRLAATPVRRVMAMIRKKIKGRETVQVGRPVQVRRPVPEGYWSMLAQRKVNTFLIFCEGGIALDIFELTLRRTLKKLEKAACFRISLVKDVDHTFTPVWAQQFLVRLLTGWVIENF